MFNEIYLDANATSPALPAAIRAAVDALGERFGNPSSSHGAGLKAKAMLDAVRARARRLLGAGAGRLTFTSGATEGIQTAVLSALCAIRARRERGEAVGDLLVYGATEHKAVAECLAHWNEVLGAGMVLRPLAVDQTGRHRLDLLREMAPRAALVCTMAANNETGVLSDLAAIEALLAECAPAALWMVDSVQALGKMRLDLAATRIDYAPFSGHKLYAPKGVGMLYVRAGAPYTPLMVGGGQESGQRSGTENMAGIAALGAVLEALEHGAALRPHAELAAFRERLADALRAAFPGIAFNMPFAHSLPTTLNFSVAGLAGSALLDVFDAAGVRVSSGSACSAATAAPSHVLEAMGLPAWRASAAVRMSFGPMADQAFIDAACARIARCGAALRDAGLLPGGASAANSPCIEQQHTLPGAAAATAEERIALALDPAGLAAFLLEYPGARLVDVREAWEHAAGGAGWQGRSAENVPLALLPRMIDQWLQGDRPALVFFCRSGNRSERAALSLRRRGYRNAWHVAGGLALAA